MRPPIGSIVVDRTVAVAPLRVEMRLEFAGGEPFIQSEEVEPVLVQDVNILMKAMEVVQ